MTLSSATYHIPVLLKESIEGLNVSPDGTYADMTFGGGGHSRELLSRLGAGGRLFGFDQDGDAEARVESGEWLEGSPLADDNAARGTFTFVRSNFRYLTNWMRYYGVDHLDGVLADLGVSSHHFDDSSRGFSFRFDAPLDMRMNRRAKATAADILARYDEEELARVFHVYGELKNARRLASAIVSRRRTAPVATTGDLVAVAGELLRRDREKKELAKVFQALRIEVNNEMGALEEMLLAATEMLRPGGRLVVITYHSIEDRMVKNIMKAGNVAGTVEQDFYGRISTPYRLVGKVTVPDDSEQQANPRSRSAKLRKEMTKKDQDIQITAAEEAVVVPAADAAAGQEAAPEPEADTTEETDDDDAAEKAERDALKEAIAQQAREDEQPSSATFTLRKILGGDILTAHLMRSQIWLVVLIVFFMVAYISNRYSVQKDLLEIDRLNKELKDAKYKALSSSSQLTEKCRESHVLEVIRHSKDSILKMPSQPPYIITVPKNK